MDKQKILDNVEFYSADELVGYIQQGIVTFDELVSETDGDFDASKRKEVKQKLESGDSDAWENAKKTGTVDAIQKYLDTYPNGEYRNDARLLKQQLQSTAEKQQMQSSIEKTWQAVDKTSKEALQDYIRQYPTDIHVSEATALINQILLDEIMGVNAETLVCKIHQFQTESENPTARDNKIIAEVQRYLKEKRITKEEFLAKIQEDNNLLNAGIVKRLIENGDIAIGDLLSIGIDKLFIQKMFNGEAAHTFREPEPLEKIHKQSTEIYFWGIPSSGKSCALGAILSVAANGTVAHSMDPDTGSQGFGYMQRLINLFQNGQVGTLMGGTPIEAFYEMGFDLVDNNGKIHPITCIDMAGELMRCMHKSMDNEAVLEDKDIKMLDTMTKVLIDNKTTSRKMHFFVIEYGAEDRLYEGLPQLTYLTSAVSYIKNTGIFDKETDAVYIMITKADKVKNPTKGVFKQYINEKYKGFYNGLEQICKDKEINGKRVEMLAFSLGEVCFQNYCKFDSRPAENVVNLILQRSASYRGGKRGMFEKIFRG